MVSYLHQYYTCARVFVCAIVCIFVYVCVFLCLCVLCVGYYTHESLGLYIFVPASCLVSCLNTSHTPVVHTENFGVRVRCDYAGESETTTCGLLRQWYVHQRRSHRDAHC